MFKKNNQTLFVLFLRTVKDKYHFTYVKRIPTQIAWINFIQLPQLFCVKNVKLIVMPSLFF